MNPIGCGNSFRRWNAEDVRKWNPLDAGIHFDSQNWSASMFPHSDELLVVLVEWTPLDADIHLDTSSRLRSSAFTAENEPHWVREFISFHVSRPLESLLESRFWSCFRILLHDADRLQGMNPFLYLYRVRMNPSIDVGIHLGQLTRISHILFVELDDYSMDRL